MTNEITIFPNSSGNGVDELLSAPQGSSTQPPPAPPTPLRRLHRLLRGRYLLAMFLCGVGAAAGAIGGWCFRGPAYRVDGLVQIDPNVINATEADRVMPMLSTYVNGQVAMLQSDRVISAAMDSDEWKTVTRKYSPYDQPTFEGLLDVANIKNTTLIRVSFIDYNAEMAMAAVKAVLASYDDLYGNSDRREREQRIKVLEDQSTKLTSDKDYKQKLVDGLAQKYGSDDLSLLHENKLREVTNLESVLNQQEATLALARANLELKKGTPPAPINLPALIDQIATSDPQMRYYLTQKEAAETNLSRMAWIYFPGHRKVIEANHDVEAMTKKIEDYAMNYSKHLGPGRSMISTDLQNATAQQLETQADIDQFAAKVDQLRKAYDREKAVLNDIAGLRGTLQNLKTDIVQKSDMIRGIARKVEEINAEIKLSKRILITYPRDVPKLPTVDKRKQFAVLGFAAGGALPLSLLLLIGLMDGRYRYSDDTGIDLAGVPLLGVLPNLPDRLSDPDQAAIASHCVHQIRSMLQIEGSGQNRHVWAITSAAPGDGKTSLTLSLALSYAACGSRTLLIDCDLVGGGLSARLNIKSPQGVLDAIASRTLLQYVHSTDAADVAILPAGAATPQMASALSPAALRRLIIEAKRHFEVVLIDTGPVLGSIEASLVATAVDGVIVAVARGQQRHLVDKAVTHLHAIGARIAGIVFNRANDADFNSQLSGQSHRLQGRAANGHGDGSPFGPVARAVASSSFKGNESE